MRRIPIIISLLYSCFVFAKPSYQIDLIIFAQNTASFQHDMLLTDVPLIPMSTNANFLKPSSGKTLKPYFLLPGSYSSLHDHYYQLSHRSRYPVLGHYSWRQPANSQTTVALPRVEQSG